MKSESLRNKFLTQMQVLSLLNTASDFKNIFGRFRIPETKLCDSCLGKSIFPFDWSPLAKRKKLHITV